MPYIPKEDRLAYNSSLSSLALQLAELDEEKLAGHLNYCVSKLAFLLFEHRKKYVRINTINGALLGAQQEFSRRKVNPYEDEKIKTEGDI